MQVSFTPRYTQLREFRKHKNQLDNNIGDPTDSVVVMLNTEQFDIDNKEKHHSMLLDDVNYTTFKKRQKYNKRKKDKGEMGKKILIPLVKGDFANMNLTKNVENNTKRRRRRDLGVTTELQLRELAADRGMGRDVFLGTFGIDELYKTNMNLKEVARGNNVGFIINYSPRSGTGTHWVSLARDDGNWLYFDPFGIEPPLQIGEYLDSIGISKFLRNTVQLQDIKTDLCGYYNIYFLNAVLQHDKSFAEFLTSLQWDENLTSNTDFILNRYS